MISKLKTNSFKLYFFIWKHNEHKMCPAGFQQESAVLPGTDPERLIKILQIVKLKACNTRPRP